MSWTEDWLWPKVDLRRRAQNAIEEGFWVACFLSFLYAMWALIGVLRDATINDIEQFGVAALFAALAFGIRRRSRVAAISALILYVLARVAQGWASLSPFQVVSFLFILAFVNCIRGAFAYRKFPAISANTPSVAESFSAMAAAKPVALEQSKSGNENS